MQILRPATERGTANFGWLNSKHSFSFGNYYDPEFMGFGPLRVINEDRVQPGRGFDTHGHRDMEIISYVLDGALEHKDNLGTGSVIRPGDLQRMTAGTGVMHSEFNASATDPVHFLQIWIEPDELGLEPSYEQKHYSKDDTLGVLKLIGSQDGREGSVKIHQDLNLFASVMADGSELATKLDPNRRGWLQLARGKIAVNDELLSEGDGIALKGLSQLSINAHSDAEFLFFDMAA